MSLNDTPTDQKIKTNVCVIGGGIAGLSAAVFLCKNKYNVTVIESSPRLGGRAYSFFEKNINQFIDNGQHIMASWYENTFEFLKIIGTSDKLKFQNKLRVNFIDSDGKQYLFKCPKLHPPFHLIWGLFNYKPLKWSDKFGIIRLMKYLRSKKFSDDDLKNMTVTDLFEKTNQSKKVILYFWKPFNIAVFNAQPEETCAWNFVKIFEKGFLEKNGSKLVLPKSDLNSLYVEPSKNFIENNGSVIYQNSKIVKVNYCKDKIISLILDNGKEIKFNFLISAIPFLELENLMNNDPDNEDYKNVNNLTYSPIVNIHHFYENGESNILNDDGFAGLLNTVGQWIFKINNGHICIVISSANSLLEKDKDLIIEESKIELKKCIPALKNVKFNYSRVVKEKRATFLPDIKSVSSRPGNKTKYKNFFIAGDWTNTGYPATIEGAVTSAKNCVNEIINQNNISLTNN
jgi:zeta-carotene desaturase